MQMLKDYINGQWVEGIGNFIDVYNPSTGRGYCQCTCYYRK